MGQRSKQASSRVPSANDANLIEEAVKKALDEAVLSSRFIESIVNAVVAQVTDRVVKELEKSVQFNAELISELNNKLREKEIEIQKLKEDCNAKCDNLEQYQRRNSLRIFGVKESTGENTDVLALSVFNSIGVDVNLNDLDRSHRVGPRTEGKNRPIIVKFTSYRVRQAVFRAKKNLKGTSTTIREDLTASRLAVLMAAVQRFGLSNTWSQDGDTIIKMKDGRKLRISRMSEIPHQ